MKKYYILNPSTDINSLCTSMLDETCFHSSLTIVDSDGSNKQYFAWEVTLKQLRQIYKAAGDKGISLVNFKVAAPRTRSKQSPRILQKEEYLEGYQSQKKRPERLKQIMAGRRKELRH